jgi:4-aminobutyrate aminotransferase-like enzyme
MPHAFSPSTRTPQNRDVLCHDAAYHGTTMACAWMSPCEHYNASEHLRRPKWLQVLAKPDPFRGVYSRDEYDEGSGELASRYVADAHAVIADRAKKGHRVAACLVESIMGVGGQVIYPEGYVQELAKVVRAGGGLMVADEVQTGLGRTGTAMWAFEEQGYTPDIVTMGKPMGNGFPIAAVFTSRAISQAFTESGEYFNTFGGSQVASAVGIAVLDVLEDEGLVENANTIGKYLMKKLSALKEKHPEIGDVRGSGLFIGLEFVVPGTKEPDAAACMATVNKVKENGILTGYDGPDQNILRIKPPMCFSKANAKQLLAALDTALTMRRLKEEHLTPEFEDEAAATSP